jgi:hypothetical protein
MSAVNTKIAQALFPLLAATLLAAGCKDSTGPTTGTAGSDIPASPAPATDSAAVSASTALPTASPGVAAHVTADPQAIPSGYRACRVHTFTAHGSRTYTGMVYARLPYSVLVYYVLVKNYNILAWSGTVSIDRYSRDTWLLPYGSRWMSSPAIFLGPGQRRWQYTITVSPNSDASVLGLTVYAPRCS